jgi:hypothetical protein
VFGPSSTQEQVFNELKPLVTSCMDGFSVTIFAYGQTGSGKVSQTPTHPRTHPTHGLAAVFVTLSVYSRLASSLRASLAARAFLLRTGPQTYTMEGGSSPDGLCYRAFQELFSIRDSRCESGRMSYAIKVSMLEIYNEQVRKGR